MPELCVEFCSVMETIASQLDFLLHIYLRIIAMHYFIALNIP
jgi:hypothetical protein